MIIWLNSVFYLQSENTRKCWENRFFSSVWRLWKSVCWKLSFRRMLAYFELYQALNAKMHGVDWRKLEQTALFWHFIAMRSWNGQSVFNSIDIMLAFDWANRQLSGVKMNCLCRNSIRCRIPRDKTMKLQKEYKNR